MKAVRFDEYGGVDVLEVREVEDPVAGPGRLLVAGQGGRPIRSGEIAIREGLLHERWPATFPSGEGTDLAGVVRAVGDGVTVFAVGDEVLGWTEQRASHAELVAVPEDQLTAGSRHPVPWEVAGLAVRLPRSARLRVGAGGGSAGRRDGRRLGGGRRRRLDRRATRASHPEGDGHRARRRAQPRLAAKPWRRAEVTYGDGQADRIRAVAGGPVDAFIDTFGGGYVDLAIELGVAPQRINTIIDTAAVERFGVHAQGTHAIASAPLLAEITALVADGSLEIPIARTPYPA